MHTMRLASPVCCKLVLLIAVVITGVLFVCTPVAQSNVQTFLGPNGTE